MARILLFNKPWGVLSQFTDREGRPTLANFIDVKDVYPAGRLDRDSEGLLILTDSGALQSRIAEPRHKMSKTYFVQVEGVPDERAMQTLREGVVLKDGLTRPAKASLISEPVWLWPRQPPVRFRQHIPTQWLSLTITEGRNRQVRRMTAAIGHPTLRLIRYRVGSWTIDGLAPGEYLIV